MPLLLLAAPTSAAAATSSASSASSAPSPSPPAAARPPLELPPQMPHALREVHLDPPVVEEHVVHLQIRALGRPARLEAHESVAQGVAASAGRGVPHDVARDDAAEPAKDDF